MVDTVMDTTGDMVLDTTVDTTVDTMATPTTESMARDLLRLPLLLRQRLKLTPGMDTTVDMVLDTMVDTTADTMATPTEATTECMASKKGTSNSGLMSMKCHRF